MDFKFFGSLGQPVGVSGHICIRSETDLAIDTTLYHMNGKSSWAESELSRHLICNAHVGCEDEDVNCRDERVLQELDCKSCEIKSLNVVDLLRHFPPTPLLRPHYFRLLCCSMFRVS